MRASLTQSRDGCLIYSAMIDDVEVVQHPDGSETCKIIFPETLTVLTGDSIKLFYNTGEVLKCPSCDCTKVTTTWIDHEFQYGTDGDHVMLECIVPQRTCSLCGEMWLDYAAEEVMDTVIRVHLSPP